MVWDNTAVLPISAYITRGSVLPPSQINHWHDQQDNTGCGAPLTLHSMKAMASASAGEPLLAVTVSTPAKRSAPGGKRCRKCCEHGQGEGSQFFYKSLLLAVPGCMQGCTRHIGKGKGTDARRMHA